MTIAIVGSGIGGITTALFLEKLGVPFEIFEQSPEIKPVGAGIILAHNAMQVFDKLGLKDSIKQSGSPLRTANIATDNLQIINKIDTQFFDKKYAVESVAIQRGKLQSLLIDQLRTKNIQLNKRVIDVKEGSKTSIIFADGSVFKCDAVIGADGINSVIRNKLFKESTLRKPNQICWRGISNITLPQALKNELNELWGKGSRFGFVELSDNQVYWYALQNNDKTLKKDGLLSYFKHYHPIVNDIISHTNIDNIFESEISDLKPISSWFKSSVCLLGDAAHATTPNLGQGACQAIEDAYVLSYYLHKHSISTAFHKYEQSRKNKANMIVNLSWRLGYISQLKNPIFSALRNFAMRSVPQKLNIKQSEKIYDLVKL